MGDATVDPNDAIFSGADLRRDAHLSLGQHGGIPVITVAGDLDPSLKRRGLEWLNLDKFG